MVTDLQVLANRGDLVASESTEYKDGPLNGKQAADLVQQCRNAPRDWWVGKFVKMEIPSSKLLHNDVLVKGGEGPNRGRRSAASSWRSRGNERNWVCFKDFWRRE